jgi:hypothetical protein
MAQAMISPHVGDEIVSCYKDPAELVLFREVQRGVQFRIARDSGPGTSLAKRN